MHFRAFGALTAEQAAHAVLASLTPARARRARMDVGKFWRPAAPGATADALARLGADCWPWGRQGMGWRAMGP